MKKPEKMLELYQFEECPYCKRVRTHLTDMEMAYVIHNVPRDKTMRDELEKISGQVGVPTLVDPNTGTVIPDDDDKIIKYLDEKYGTG